jgi:ubiquinone/menaquinone biosynthesis C-methylase UbiE
VTEPGDNQKTLWASRADAYDRWADAQAQFAEGFNRPLLEAAGVGPNARVLDVAAGAGEPALSAARDVAPGGYVVASDFAPRMLAGAVRRAQAQGQRRLGFVAASMTALPFNDGEFDAVTCRFGLMFVPAVEQALAESRRVLGPAGRAAFMVWGPIAENTLSAAIIKALDDVIGPQAGDLERLPFRLGKPGQLTALMREAGFANAEETAIRSKRRMPIGQPFWGPTMEKCLGADWDADEARRSAIDAAVAACLEGSRDGNEYEISNHVRIGVGRTAP